MRRLKMKAQTLFLCIVCVIAFSVNVVLAQEVIKTRVSQWPPQYYQDDDGNWTGVDVELTRAIIEKAGFEVEFIDLPWTRGVQYLKNGKVDMIPGFAVNDERKAYTQWIGPHRNVTVVLVVKKGNTDMPIKSLDDMISIAKERGKLFGHQDRAFWSKEYNDRLEHDAEFRAAFEIVYKGKLNLIKLREDRVLGFFEIKGAILYRINHDPKYAGLAIHPFVLDSRPTYIGVGKHILPDKFKKLEQAYQILEQDGTLQKIREKWGY